MTRSSDPSSQDCVIVDRGGIDVAVTDCEGRILYAVGDPSRVTLARSAAKPAQAVAVIESGGFEAAGLDNVDLALMCASHSSVKRHVDVARAMIKKVKVDESYYRCGGHPSLSDIVNREWIQTDMKPTGIHNNCSGKHAGMMAGARALGADVSKYHLPDQPMQILVKQVVQELCPEPTMIRWAVDGCNLPAPAFPLSYLARMYALFAAAADCADRAGECSWRTKNLSRVFTAMTANPEYVGGDGRFCTELMQRYKGLLIGKLGADGCYGIGIRENGQRQGPMGISVKIDDGNIEILYAVVMEVLERLKIGTPDMRQSLSKWHFPEKRNTMGIVTGAVSFNLKLRCMRG
ncbi:hypothetical protein QQS21_007439 [Conoideocrella luteorostrata]|uniref:L-asparaginase II n=1 Tax=Conoideocrella luteorostrata TaxID=1105319 RepID=A0AAJ0FS24_9HYPO|nr:hypothetical protein QQS21_007439 [Conoideocrella luteorostrata]